MTNRDHLVDGLHSVLAGLWEGADETAAAEFRNLSSWCVRAVKSSTPTYRSGTFPGPVVQDAQDLVFLQSAADGMRRIESAFLRGDSKETAQLVKELLTLLSERQPA
jgi:hypothetical protein